MLRRHDRLRLARAIGVLIAFALVPGIDRPIRAQAPPAQAASSTTPVVPQPVRVAAAPVVEGPAAVGDRLRRMEELNQKLLLQFNQMARQNEALTRQVEALSKRLDKTGPVSAANPGESDASGDGSVSVPDGAGSRGETAPALSESAARPSRSPADSASNRSTTPGGGGGTPTDSGTTRDPTAPSLSESAARPSRNNASGANKPGSRTPLTSYYDQQRYGYILQSENQEFELRFNAMIQADARIYEQRNQSPVLNDIDIPRMRLYFAGRMTKPYEYQISLQRTTNSLDLLNAYINVHYDDRFQVRFGRFKSPFTYEWYKMSIWEMATPDRSPFALNFGPNRQVGLMGWGFLFKERLEYAVGLMDGARNSYQDFNNNKDLMALLDFKPFYQTESPLKNLGIGGSVDSGRENNPAAPAVLRTSTSASTNPVSATSGDNLIAVPFLAFNNNVRERGDRLLWELHTTYFYKSLSLIGIWDGGHNDFAQNGNTARPVHLPVSGYSIQGSYLLTGETRQRQSLVDPIHPFDLRRGKFGLGAFEVQARLSGLTVGRQVFTAGLADPNAWTDRVDMIDVGMNWYLNKFVKFYFDWEHAVFAQPVSYASGPLLQKTSDLFWLRLQIYL